MKPTKTRRDGFSRARTRAKRFPRFAYASPGARLSQTSEIIAKN